jgi:tetratricopeptide (TPR) repeat protein
MALKINPNSAECHFNVANAFVDKGSKKEALPHFQEVVKLDTTNVEALFEMAEIYNELGKAQKAKETYEKVLEIQKDHKKAQQAIDKLNVNKLI